MAKNSRGRSTAVGLSRVGTIFNLRIDAFSIVLLIATAALMLWYRVGMNTSLVLEPGETLSWFKDDKRDGGNSKTSLVTDSAWRMRCEISDSSTYAYPYCALYIALSDGDGVDLRAYDSLRVTMSYRSTEPDNARIYLNHFPESDTLKFPFKMNLRRLEPDASTTTYDIPFSSFVVPFWWVCQSQSDDARPEFSRVKHLSLTTGESVSGRNVEIDVYRVEFRGKWLAESDLYQGLLYAWMAWVVALLMLRAYRLTRLSRRLRSKSDQLEISNRHLNSKSKRFEKLATHDELTGLVNRHGLRVEIDIALRDFTQNQQPFCLLLLDIDHFKAVNDELGHDVGDKVLKQLADIIRLRCRRSDLAVRWGGEEFLIVCRYSVLKEAHVLAENMRESVREAHFLDDRTLTCSIGVVEMKDGDTEELFKRADQALYKAKAAGRDCVSVFTD